MFLRRKKTQETVCDTIGIDHCLLTLQHANRCRSTGQIRLATLMARSVFPILLFRLYQVHFGDPSRLTFDAMLQSLKDRKAIDTSEYITLFGACTYGRAAFDLDFDCRKLLECCGVLAILYTSKVGPGKAPESSDAFAEVAQ